jgi:hypothetical protein
MEVVHALSRQNLFLVDVRVRQILWEQNPFLLSLAGLGVPVRYVL